MQRFAGRSLKSVPMAESLPLLLYVTAHPPFASEPFAGHRIAARHLDELRQHHRVVVLILAGGGSLVRQQELLSMSNVEAVEWVHCATVSKVSGLLLNAPRVPFRYTTRLVPGARKVMLHLLQRYDFQRVWFEFSQVLPLIELTGSIPSTVVMHDLQLQVALRGGRLDRLFAGATATYERGLLERASEILVLSPKDADLIVGLYSLRPRVIKPYFQDYSACAVQRALAPVEGCHIVFWGNLSRSENEEAIWRFINTCLPSIRAQIPEAELLVVGASPSHRLKSVAAPGVTVTGFVDDPSSLFLKAKLAVVPLLAGAGVKIKVLELLSAGLPVISTEIGAEGIEPDPLLSVVPLEQFVPAIVAALKRD